jgi:hypothetical protein
MGVVAGIAQRWVIGIGFVNQVSATDWLHHFPESQQHDVAVAFIERVPPTVVPAFYTTFHMMVSAAEFSQNSWGIFVAGVLAVPALEDADGGDT